MMRAVMPHLPPEGLAMMRPQLPRAAALLPYLEQIDAARTYSNWGPLCLQLQQRLHHLFAAPQHGVICANSGFSALLAALLAHAGLATAEAPRRLAVVPSYTFTATAMAAVQCGYQLLLVDVDPHTWALEPAQVLAQIQPWLAQVGVVVPVAPYGRALDYAAWVNFQQEHGIPVVIDAAASFERFCEGAHPIGEVPIALSFHATKTFSTAEGGAVLTAVPAVQQAVAAGLNFGFFGSRESRVLGINGKLSEYHAAVGLAELDGWAHKQAQLHQTAQAFAHMAAQYGLERQLVHWPEVASCYAFFLADNAADADAATASLARQGVASRRWYNAGLHQHAAYQDAVRANTLACTEQIGQQLIGLPLHFDMPASALQQIGQALAQR
jgi:dTDP-4-amino-4,6-dideoxygalactose transaminase